jgi:HAE1 family hydrophobic/amphiphilic exporter-1
MPGICPHSGTGSGSVGLQIMGTAVIGGMLAATVLAIFVIPSLSVLIERLAGLKKSDVHDPVNLPKAHPMEAD